MKTDARKLSLQERCEKRFRALRMRKQGYPYRDIGEAVGVHPRTIAYWAQGAEHKGEKTAIAGGQRCVRQSDHRSLSPSQEVPVRTLMTDKMPDQLKLGFAVWTRDAVRELILQRCGFLMPVRAVGEYKRWGFTLQRAYKQKPEGGQRWLDNEYPRIVQRAKAENGEISGVTKLACGVTAMLAAATPLVVKRRCARSVAVVFFHQHNFHCDQSRPLTAPVLIRFLGRLIRDAQGGQVFLILDNLCVCHNKKVSAWVADRKE